MKITYEVNKSLSIRQWFREHYINLTYDQLQMHLRLKDITLDGKKTNPQYILKKGDKLLVWDKIPQSLNEFDPTKAIIDPSLILYKDENICVIDKPYNICSQGDREDSIFLMLQNMVAQEGKRCYVVHRLDKYTSGVLIFALNRDTAMEICNSIHTWDKKYIAILPASDLESGKVETIEEDKRLVTHYKTLTGNNERTIVEFTPKTGKKHQIRKHAAYLGYPILGDKKYGSRESTKMHLHCRKISFSLYNKDFNMESPIPDHIAKSLKEN